MRKFVLLSLWLLLGCFFSLSYAQTNKLGPYSSYRQSIYKNDGNQYPLLVKGDKDAIYQLCKQVGGEWINSYGNIHRLNIPLNKLDEFLSHHGEIQSVKDLNTTGLPLMDTALIVNNVDSIHQGYMPLGTAFTGKDVVIGVIDDGIDFNHHDFKNPDGSTRIRYIWDQNFGATAISPVPYGYGKEWNWIDINNGNCNMIESGSAGHGSHVTGIAAGNGSAVGKYKGMAPEADIVSVKIKYDANFEGNVIDAIDYIFGIADAMGKPCVINTSIGTYYGGRDGRDLTSQAIENMLNQRKGRLVVAAAGNAGDQRIHVGYNVSSDTSFTWFKDIAYSGKLYFDFWAEETDMPNIFFAVEAIDPTSFASKGSTPFYNISFNFPNLSSTGYDELTQNVVLGGLFAGQVSTYARKENGAYHIECEISPNVNTDYWSLKTVGSGRIDFWADKTLIGTSNIVKSALPADSIYLAIVFYKNADFSSNIVASWQCSQQVVTVGNFNNRTSFLNHDSLYTYYAIVPGDIYTTSSHGPSRDGRYKPDLCATGGVVLSTGNAMVIGWDLSGVNSYKVAVEGKHRSNSGTSMASPMVAGVAALYFEKNPDASWLEVAEVLRRTAKQDTFTGTTPNDVWGYGKLNGFRAMLYDAVLGCTDTAAFNYNPLANIDDGSCVPKIYGCTDSLAANYNPGANIDDGSCTYDTTGIEYLTENFIGIYPNPVSHVLTVDIKLYSGKTFTLYLFNEQLQEVQLMSLHSGKNEINVEKLASGLYICELKDANQVLLRKKIVVH